MAMIDGYKWIKPGTIVYWLCDNSYKQYKNEIVLLDELYYKHVKWDIKICPFGLLHVLFLKHEGCSDVDYVVTLKLHLSGNYNIMEVKQISKVKWRRNVYFNTYELWTL